MIQTFKVTLMFGLYAKSDWEGVFEIDTSSTLNDVHHAIQKALDFDDDHLYEFYTARTNRSRPEQTFNDENEGIYKMKLEKLYPLPQGRHLFYLFDYGDNWLFKISKMRTNEQPPVPGVQYPRLIQEIGEKPEQYPAWEDEGINV
jgi:hypothetical protein